MKNNTEITNNNNVRKTTPARTAFCPAAGKCGGCQLENMTYERQLAFKQAYTIKLLGRFCHIGDIIPADTPVHYRHKVSAAFGRTKSGQIISGVYQSSNHNIVKVSSCMLEDEGADEIIASVRRLLISFKLSVYNENTGNGFLRHVLVRKSFANKTYMVVLVTGEVKFPGKNSFIKALREMHPEIVTIVQNINSAYGSMVLGDRNILLFGSGRLEDEICGCRFAISPTAFYQINPPQAEKLYNKAIEFTGLTGNETVIDAYCGTGTIGIIASRGAKTVIGAELNAQAIRDARLNAGMNNASNVSFVAADAADFMSEAAKDSSLTVSPDDIVVIADPPRAGCSMKFLNSLAALSPARFVYISCNPETQARDIAILVKKGYKAEKAIPVDMFPYTKHVETVCCLRRR